MKSRLVTLREIREKHLPKIKTIDDISKLNKNPNFLKLSPMEQRFIIGALINSL